MLYFLYDMLHLLVLLVLIPYYLVRGIGGKKRLGLAERLGMLSRQKREELERCRGGIWIHAVSVGETIAVRPLVAALKEACPQRKIIFSTVTETGRSISEKIPGIDARLYFPFDLSFAVRKTLTAGQPSMLVVVETEIWPNFLRQARLLGIPAVMVNGRISDRSFPRYLRFRWLLQRILTAFDALCMQTDEDAARIVRMGAPPERVQVCRNLKYDLPPCRLTQGERSLLRSRYGIPEDAFVFTAGSTHRGEEEKVLAAYSALAAVRADAFLVLAPRHPERAAEVEQMLLRMDIPSRKRSTLMQTPESLQCGGVLLLDTVGELLHLYALSDVVFVGGSLVPVGGHNVLEPLAAGAPVLFGPHMNNFREISVLVAESGGGLQLSGGDEVATELVRIASDEPLRRRMAADGEAVFAATTGSVERHLNVLRSVLEKGA